MDPRQLSRRDLRRLVHDMWEDPRCDEIAAPALDAAFASRARSVERTLIQAYLRHFPVRHGSFRALQQAVSMIAESHDWPWRQRGRDWGLWDEKRGPNNVAKALLECEDPNLFLQNIGLDGDLGQGRFVSAAFEASCEFAASSEEKVAQRYGERLIKICQVTDIGRRDDLLVWALFTPWAKNTPSENHRKLVTSFITSRVGDPRTSHNAWSALLSRLAISRPNVNISLLLETAKRWLVRATVKEFFDIVAKTTDNPFQWSQRTEFWTGYLEHDLIDDAWFVLGPRAEEHFRSYRTLRVGHGRIRAGDGGAGHSALMMRMRHLVIAEWSDNGACRFWPESHAEAPKLGQPTYYRSKLKVRTPPPGCDKFAHLPSPGWEPKFARHVYQQTGIRHPDYGSGGGN